MEAPPYKPPNGVASPPMASPGNAARLASYKWLLSILCIAMYCAMPWRIEYFLRTVQANEGFGTTDDSITIPIVGVVIATVLFSPIALPIIVCGIAKSTRIQFLPKLDRFTLGWGIIATALFACFLYTELDHVARAVRYWHHRGSVAASILYVFAAYLWWCCSLCHGQPRMLSSNRDAG